MIPSVNDDVEVEFEEVVQPSKTYKLDLVRNKVVGYVDGREAVEQAIYKALATDRYEYLIYSWNYGAEIAKLFGQPIPYVYSELKRLITEALTHDDRIDSVDAFTFSHVKGTVSVSFICNTIYGDIEAQTEVDV